MSCSLSCSLDIKKTGQKISLHGSNIVAKKPRLTVTIPVEFVTTVGSYEF